MSLRHVASIIFVIAVLAGCAATPQIQLSNDNMSMHVNAKAPIINSVAYSRDGKSVLSGGADQNTRLWDLVEARQAKFFKGHTGQIVNVSYSPDGKTIAVSSLGGATNFSNYAITIWDVATGNELKQIDGMGALLSFTQDGKFIMGSTGGFSAGITKIWDIQNNKEVKEFKTSMGKISPDGNSFIACDTENKSEFLVDIISTITLFDLNSGATIWSKNGSKNVNSCSAPQSFDDERTIAFSPNGHNVLIANNISGNIGSDFVTSFELLDARTGNLIKEFGRTITPVTLIGSLSLDDVPHEIGAIAFSPDGKTFLSADLGNHLKLWDLDSGSVIRIFKTVDESSALLPLSVPSIAFSPDGRLVVENSLSSTRLYDVLTGNEVATMISFEDGEWLVTTPSGYYNSSAKGDQYLDVSVGGKLYSTSQLRESFFRPDLVKLALAGGSLTGFKKINDIKQPPTIEIVNTPTSIAADQITISLHVKDQGGGIGDVRLYRNGTAVVLEKTRNLQVASSSDGSQVLRFTVSLEQGKNTIRAIAFNGDNTMQSNDSLLDIDAKIATRKPSLYAVVVGIQNFENPRLDLTYSIADAKLFANTLEKHGKGLYSTIHVQQLITLKETTKDAIIAALTLAQKNVKPEDLFVFYVASHGTVDDGQYLLITSNVGSTNYNKLKQEALSQDQLKNMISNISASKKLVVLDTCDAGKMGDALQVALLTRGMSNDTAMNILSRAVGSTILSAATSDQEALEGYKGHGLFTYVVAEGLGGAADANHDGFVKTLELADYVDSTVPELAMSVFNHRQYPIVSPTGEGFPLSEVK